MHDWERAVDDFSFILHYQPHLLNIYCLRARAYCCMRQWNKAMIDYNKVLSIDSNYETAIHAMYDIEQKYEDLPMVDETLVAEAMR